MRSSRAVAVLLVLAATPAWAQELDLRDAAADSEDSSTSWSSLVPPSYLWDGGALPFLWGALGARMVIDQTWKSRSEPLGFSESEGGASRAPWEVPGWAVTAAGGAVGMAMALGDHDSRWHHVKGLAETLATGAFATGVLKLTFSRYRPDYNGDPSDGFGAGNRSFPSGHSTQAFEIATYAALYLRYHGFDKLRPHGSFRWWEGAAYAGIYAGASLVAAERVLHHRHHLTDVLAGAALGTTVSTLFFLYQERRYQRARHERPSLSLRPEVSSTGLGVQLETRY